jgi:hypothetical protein
MKLKYKKIKVTNYDKIPKKGAYEIEWPDGTKLWYLNDQLHREDGPAIEYPNGTKYWYLNDEEYTKQEYYNELVKRKLITRKQAFIEML